MNLCMFRLELLLLYDINIYNYFLINNSVYKIVCLFLSWLLQKPLNMHGQKLTIPGNLILKLKKNDKANDVITHHTADTTYNFVCLYIYIHTTYKNIKLFCCSMILKTKPIYTI